MFIYTYFCRHVFIFLFSKELGLKLLVLWSVHVNFIRNYQTGLQSSFTINTPTNRIWEFQCPAFSSTHGIYNNFKFKFSIKITFIIKKCPSLFLFNFLVLKSTFSDTNVDSPSYDYCLYDTLFCILTCESLKFISYRQYILKSYFFIESNNFCLLMGAFRPFIFTVIINIVGFKYSTLTFAFFLFFPHFYCHLMDIMSIFLFS